MELHKEIKVNNRQEVVYVTRTSSTLSSFLPEDSMAEAEEQQTVNLQ
jgi:hypothetical protein